MATEIEPGVYDITTRLDDNGRRYRAYLFDDEVPTLIDAGHVETTGTLIGELEDLGVAPERLLITHGDGDHVGGVDDVIERFDPEVAVPTGVDLGSDVVEVDRRLEDGETIDGFTVVHTPGHVYDHFAYVHTERGVAVLGDAAFGSDLRGLPVGYFILPPGAYSDDVNQADASLDRLLDYEFDVALVSHGSSVLEDAGGKLERFVNFPGRP